MWARQKAIDNNIDLSQFFSVVVCTNVPETDLFGGPDGVVCDDGRWNIKFLSGNRHLKEEELGTMWSSGA